MRGKKMKYKILLMFILWISSQLPGQSYHNVTWGLIYPISTNKSKTDSTRVNLALIQNSVGEVSGANICGFSAISKGSVTGVQTSFLYSQIDDNLKGVTFSAVNVVNDSIKGIQASVAASLLGRSFKGVQSSSIVNFVGGEFTGYQQSAVYNIVGKSFVGAHYLHQKYLSIQLVSHFAPQQYS